MAQEIDYSTLKWVKDEIDESLKQTRQALEAYVENPEDKTQIRFCATYLHQIYGTLQMVEIYGGSLLAEEMELLCNAILNDKIQQKDEAYDVLMRSILQLPSYLEHIEQGQPDQPVILLPLLNDIRSARGEHLLSDNAFFSPNLSVSPPTETGKIEKKPVELTIYAKKLRTVYQACLVGIYRDNNVKGNLKKIGAVFRELMTHTDSDNGRRLWWISTGVIEALLEEGIELSNALKQVIGQLDKQIKLVISKGEQAFADTPTELIKNLLYYVATATSEGKRVSQIKQAFNLESLIPANPDINQAYDNLRGSTQDLMNTVSAVIKEDLLQVKDQLDIFVRSGDRSATQLKPLEEQLSRIADTLAMLGLGDLRKIITDQIHSIDELIASGTEPSDVALMEIASSLLYIESSLEGVEPTKSIETEEGEEDTLLPSSEQKQLSKLVIAEAADVLAKVKDNFNTFANDPSQISTISNTPEYLSQVKGVLTMLSFDQAAALLGSAIGYIGNEIVKKQTQPNQVALDAIADVITSIEYYLEAVTESRLHPESLLSVAEQSLSKLGYAIEPKEEVTGGDTVQQFDSISVDSPGFAVQRPSDNVLEQVQAQGQMNTEEISLVSMQTKDQVEDDISAEHTIDIPAPSGEQEIPPHIESMPTNTMEFEANTMEFEAADFEPVAEEPALSPVSAVFGVPELQYTITSVDQQLVDDVDEEILEIFIEEADEVLVVMKENLAAWKADNNNEDALTILRRSYHTIKGSGRLAGATIVGEFAWAVENMLNRVIEEKVPTSDLMFALLEQGQLALESLISQLKGESETAAEVQALAEMSDAYANGEISAAVLPVAEEVTAGEGLFNQTVQAEAVKTNAAQPQTVEGPDEGEFSEPATIQMEVVELPTQEQSLAEIFKKETSVHVAAIRSYITESQNEEQSGGKSLVNEALMRALHTLHGSARMAEATHIAALSEALDRYCRTLYDSEQHVSEDAVGVLSKSADAIAEMSLHDEDSDYKTEDYQDLLDQLTDLHRIAHAAQAVKESGTFSLSDALADKELVNIFLQETTDILTQIKELLSRWTAAVEDIRIVGEIQRTLHTLKGGARMANVLAVADVSHNAETLLEHVSEGRDITNKELVDIMHACYDWLIQALDNMHIGQAPASADDLIERMNQYSAQREYLEDATLQIPAMDTAVHADELKTTEIEISEADFALLSAVDATPAPVEPTVDQELMDVFLQEARVIQESNEHAIENWGKAIDNHEHVADMQRSLHTLKGGARMANVTVISDVAHAIETLLERISGREVNPSSEHVQLIRRCHDWLSQSLEQIKNQQAISEPEDLLNSLSEAAFNPLQATELKEPEINLEDISIESAPVEEAGSAEIIQLDTETGLRELKGIQPLFDEGVDYDDELIDVFLEEAEEIQEISDKTLHQWSNDVENRDLIAELQRALHTIKGGARMANITAIGDISHAIESLLEAVTEGNATPTEEYPKVVHACHDWLSSALNKVKQRQQLQPADGLINQLHNLLAGKPAAEGLATDSLQQDAAQAPVAELIELPLGEKAESETVHRLREQVAPRPVDEQIRVRADLVDSLVAHAGEANIYNARIEQQLNAWRFNLTELNQTVQRLHEQLRKFEIEAEAQIIYRHTSESESEAQEHFDPLELDRFSYMQQLSRGMVESLSDLSSIQNLLDSISSDADVLLLQQSRVNTDLQEGLMRTRLTPFSSVLARLRRIVRQTCQETGKDANLNVVGAEGEMDRTQLNRVVPALEHIIRNAVDHGIESPDERAAKQKPAAGNIEIRFAREGSEVVLRIIDDGAGIDINALRDKALERGLVGKDSKISDNELTEFILQSGFSTAQQVTQISGRGVGMDVVNTEIKQLNGSLHIETEQGRGTTFTIRLPLTVLVNQALMVQIAEATYAIQMSNIEHVVRVRGDILNRLISLEMEFYEYAGHQYEPLNLSQVLHGLPPAALDSKETYPLLLGRSGDHRVAMYVEALVGRQEIVIKSLGPQLSSVNNISGATILPDGEVALILDISTLIRSNLALQKLAEEGKLEAPSQPVAEPQTEKRPVVMIVDDSITVRKVTQRLLERHNYDTITAKDGVDALTMLLEQVPDVMLLDIEMPRMDGFELATAIRNDERLKHIPIIMITSRTGEKHRDRALGIGVNNYLGKPFQENELLDNIRNFVKNS